MPPAAVANPMDALAEALYPVLYLSLVIERRVYCVRLHDKSRNA